MQLHVRSWNLFHGNTQPPGRRAFLREMVELAVADRPGVVCLQEVPLWAGPLLARWSRMDAFVAVARPAPLWPPLGRAVTAVHHGLLRSAVSGQANAILAVAGLGARGLEPAGISEPGRERRVVHGIVLRGGPVVANLHTSNDDPPAARGEVERALAWLDRHAADGPAILTGDLNLRGHELPGLPGFSPPGEGIDHVLVRGLAATPLESWPEERRRSRGRLLSDHAPVELRAG